MVSETNPFTLCCIENKLLLPESRNKAKIQTHFSARSQLLLLYAVKRKDFRELFSPQKLFKKEATFKAFNCEKCHLIIFFFYNKRCRIDNEILTHLKLMGILRPEFWLEFELNISLEYCIYVLLEMWDCRVTEIPVPRCSSFIHKWSSWFCLPSWSEA